jgi:hypothetical protein
MARYLAIFGSRFRFSHNYAFMTVHALEAILKGTSITMQMRNLHGKKVDFHKAFNYLYRPIEMEEMSLYAYYCETKFIMISEAKKLAIEYFDCTEQHLFHRIEAVVYRPTAAVPRGIGFALLDAF